MGIDAGLVPGELNNAIKEGRGVTAGGLHTSGESGDSGAVQRSVERYLHYLDIDCDKKEFVGAFIGVLSPVLLSGAEIIRGSMNMWPALVRALVQLK